MKILYSDWVFDDQEERDKCDTEGSKKDNVIEEDTEISLSESVEKPKKRGRPRKSNKEVKSVKKPKRSAAACKIKKTVPSEVKSSSIAELGSQGNVINLDDEDEEVNEFEQNIDMNGNQKFSRPVTVASSDDVKSSFEVHNSTLVKEKVEVSSIRSLSTTNQEQFFSVSDQDPGVSPLPVSSVSPALPSPRVPIQLRPGEGVGMSSQEIVKSEHKMDVNDNKSSPKAVTSPKLNTSYDMMNTTLQQDTSSSSTSPHHPSFSPVSDQDDHKAHAPANFTAKQLSQAVPPMPGPRCSPGQILVRPAQPRMPRRPPGPGMGRGSARPTCPRPAGGRGPMVFPGPRLSNPRSLVPMRRSSSHPQSQYFPVTSHPASYSHQEQTLTPSPCNSPNLSNLDVSIIREIAPPTRHGWVPPPGLSMVRVAATATEFTLAISTLATALHQLGQVEGRRRSVQYRLTEEQIRALSTLGVGQEEQVGPWEAGSAQ